MLAETVQWSDRRAIGKRRKTGNAHIYADDTLRRMHRFWNFPFRLNGDVPLSSGKRDCHLFRRSLYFAAVAVAYPPDFGKEYAAVAFVQLEALRIAKGVMNPLSLETRKIRTLGKEIFVGPVQVFQCLLQYLGMGFRKKGCFFLLFPVLQFSSKGMVAKTFFIRRIGLFLQCKRLVPEKTATSGKTPHEAFLPGFGAELKLVCLQYFHRFQSIAAQTKRQKFQLRCALYPPPEGRGFTARLII